MSWQAYVDTQLLGAGASRAAICGRNDSTVWAHSAGVALLPEEIKTLHSALNEGDHTSLFRNGLLLEGVRHTVVSDADGLLHAKHGAAGVLVAATAKALLLAWYNADTRPEATNAALVALADYLRSMGY